MRCHSELLNIIANVGVIGGCEDICSKLPQKFEAVACDLVCDYVGIDEFVKIITEIDPDPVYSSYERHTAFLALLGASCLVSFLFVSGVRGC